MEKEIDHLQKKQSKKQQLKARTQWATKGETISKYWSKINEKKSPRDIIHRLKIPGTNNFTSKSEQMAEIAKTYHDKIQSVDDALYDEQTQKQVRIEALNEIPESQKLDATPNQMEETLEEKHVLSALMSSKSGSATGIDGLPYELWKHLHTKYKEACEGEKPAFNIIKMLTNVMNGIQLHGVEKDSDFALGWMCPLYKKKDCLLIENY
ncbi:hypothetical protein CY34DRAFT_94962 [Suillus luteus UH-Slu-Lm8-n1]|uniref:Uncharacterized protein n=1 Tax=Suillus luteus UH-Slu-Lm8-n1 TaxID=930992 RepID=A0A0C9ZFB6_9AGAM|nr:hypothetical protein CY34DRAFT_94962 [Suillus luteus UH-Slu-Lm8-n1]